jgi:Replication protein
MVHQAPPVKERSVTRVPRSRGHAWPEGNLSSALSYTNTLLIVRVEYFEASSPLYIERAEWRVMWEQCLRAEGRRIVDIRLAENRVRLLNALPSPAPVSSSVGDGDGGAIPSGLRPFTTL